VLQHQLVGARRPAVAAGAATLIFWCALVAFAAARPDYSHFHQAVSELGSVGTPRMWAWNLIGFILPGALLAYAGWRIGRQVAPTGWVLPGLLALGGAMMALAGLSPADMDHRTGLSTVVHLIGSNGSLLAWLAATILLAVRVRGPWRDLAVVAILAVLAVIVTFALYDASRTALTQRWLFAAFFASYLGWALMLARRRPAASA
jgi:hypothetical membrane protein